MSRKKRGCSSSGGGTGSGIDSEDTSHRLRRKPKSKVMCQSRVRNAEKKTVLNTSRASEILTTVGTLSDASSGGYEADIPSLDDMKTDQEIKDITDRLLAGFTTES